MTKILMDIDCEQGSESCVSCNQGRSNCPFIDAQEAAEKDREVWFDDKKRLPACLDSEQKATNLLDAPTASDAKLERVQKIVDAFPFIAGRNAIIDLIRKAMADEPNERRTKMQEYDVDVYKVAGMGETRVEAENGLRARQEALDKAKKGKLEYKEANCEFIAMESPLKDTKEAEDKLLKQFMAMCDESLSPDMHQAAEDVVGWLRKNRHIEEEKPK